MTCSPENVPQPLVDQLREGGLLVIPVGERYQQTMYLFRKSKDELEQQALRPTLFVPMTGEADQRRNVLPDPARPELVNGSFEEEPDQHGFVPGWYYQRQAERLTDAKAPDGKHFLLCQNQTPGRESHLMQGLAVDGREVPQLELSAQIMTQDVANLRSPQDGPRVVITFYDENRREAGIAWLGPWRGSQAWHTERKTMRVPPLREKPLCELACSVPPVRPPSIKCS